MRGIIIIAGSLTVFLVGGFALEQSGRFSSVKQALRRPSVPTAMLNYGPMGKILKDRGLIKAVPNGDAQFPASVEGEVDRNANIFQKKRQVGPYRFQANPGGMASMPSSMVISEEDFRTGWPLLSVVIDNEELYGEKGLLHPKNRWERGKQWERLAYVSYYEEGELLFTTGVGMRLHGHQGAGKKRKTCFRLYFRDDYGADRFRPGVLFGPETEPVKKLVVRKDLPRFNTPLTFDIAQQVKAIVPGYKPVLFYLNGRYMGLYTLTEHLSIRQWRTRFGHDNFMFYRPKGKSDEPSRKSRHNLIQWFLKNQKEMTLQKAGTIIDVENWTRNLFTYDFCLTGDWDQGALVRDMSGAGAKWHWVNWDMDQSFINPEENGFQKKLLKGTGVRTLFLGVLWNNDQEFRRYYRRKIMDILNHEITQEFLQARIDYYKEISRHLYHVESNHAVLDEKMEYFRKRPRFLRRQYCREADTFLCTVNGPAGIEYEIDGYREKASYQGWYFKGMPIHIKIISKEKERFSHWRINGHRYTMRQLVYPITSKTIIEPILAR